MISGKVIGEIMQIIFFVILIVMLLLGISAVILSSIDLIREYFEDRKFRKILRERDKKKRGKQ